MITEAQTLDANELDLVSGGVIAGPNGETCTDPRGGRGKEMFVQDTNLPEWVSGF